MRCHINERSTVFHITSVEIDGFWVKHTAKASFHKDVTIFIGRNGTGKTTFINLLHAVLRVDVRMLTTMDFSRITLRLADRGKKRTITVTKEYEDAPYGSITFKVAQKVYRLPIMPDDPDYRRAFRLNAPVYEDFAALKSEMGELVNIASLSVHRSAYSSTVDDDYPPTQRRSTRPVIDQRLEDLIKQLTSYQLTLSETANQISARFQRDVLASMLYDPQFDTFNFDEVFDVQLTKEKEDLSRAYRELGALDRRISGRINKHIEVLSASLTNLREAGPRGSFSIDDIMPLPLLRRTQHIIQLSLEAQKAKQEVFSPIRQFEAILRGFMEDKKINISHTGEFVVIKDDRAIAISELSSGEKQLLILLTETLLQKDEFYIFFADEPELSLHIEWQAQIIASIKLLNARTQVIVATHSPEIAGGWKNNVVDMEDVINA